MSPLLAAPPPHQVSYAVTVSGRRIENGSVSLVLGDVTFAASPLIVCVRSAGPNVVVLPLLRR
jgi:hypothetical protein